MGDGGLDRLRERESIHMYVQYINTHIPMNGIKCFLSKFRIHVIPKCP